MSQDIDLHILTRTMKRIADLLTDLETSAGYVSDIHDSVGTLIDAYIINTSPEALRNQFIRDAAIELCAGKKNVTADEAWAKAEELWSKAPTYIREFGVCDVTHSTPVNGNKVKAVS